MEEEGLVMSSGRKRWRQNGEYRLLTKGGYWWWICNIHHKAFL